MHGMRPCLARGLQSEEIHKTAPLPVLVDDLLTKLTEIPINLDSFLPERNNSIQNPNHAVLQPLHTFLPLPLHHNSCLSSCTFSVLLHPRRRPLPRGLHLYSDFDLRWPLPQHPNLPPEIPCTVGNNGPCPTGSTCTPTEYCTVPTKPCGGACIATPTPSHFPARPRPRLSSRV